jgi:hypothetical protein
MHRLPVSVFVFVPAFAWARSSSSRGGGADASAIGVIAAIAFVIAMIVMAISRSKTTITRPDGTTTVLTPSSSSTGSEPARPQKRMVGPTTMTFPTFQARSAAVQEMKLKYGSAIRFVHRAKLQQRDAWGLNDVYTLVLEIPVKCPECGETYAVDDFGFTDCPSCGKELAVYFDQGARKRVVGIARDGKVYAPEKKSRSRTRKAAQPEPGVQAGETDSVAGRFGKLG